MPLLASAALLLVASMGALVPAMVPAAGAREVAAVYPPWWNASRVLTTASRSSDIVRMGATPFVIIVRTSSPGALAHLRLGGALFFLNPIVGACGTERTV